MHNLPQSWNEVSIEQLIELKKLELNESLGIISMHIEKYCILANIEQDDEELENVDIDTLLAEISKLHFLNFLPINPPVKIKEYSLMNISKISLGEYIDICSFIENDFYDNIPKILAILYKHTKVDEWGNVIYEPYIYNLFERSIELENVSAEAYGAISKFIEFKEKVIESYKGIFNLETDDELSDDEREGLEEDEIININKEIMIEKQKKVFAWPFFVYNLAGEDIVKMKDVYSLPLIFCLNVVQMKQTIK